MKKIASFFALVASLLTLSACAAPAAAAATPAPTATAAVEYKKISAADAKARMDSGDTIIILDVRTQEEYDAGHIPGAILVPNETIVDKQPELLPDLDAEILVYCRSGNRSAQAAKKLIAIGYTNVVDFGGIIDWPYDVVTD
ncbi:MAG: rhodanese-like domain-containing protein [Christensenella sp.]|nr:rhodanese-like domain-containing protein [Christensenella sp.]